ncbi:MAG: Sbal_3080 family lipoprotein [Smithella sp.]|nr:Sbal_3080 family lipoprotein [Smithella sp.]
MFILRLILIILSLTLVFGCTTMTVRPVDKSLKVKHTCIKDGEQMCLDGQMIGVIRDGFDRHGVTTQIYSGDLPSDCENHLSYYCEVTWDLATYMKHAELRLYQGNAQIGYAEYHLRGGGGLSLMKWQSTKTKMDPVIDELLNGFVKE